MTPLPSLFVSHGSPMFALEPGLIGPQLQALGRCLPRPSAILVVSPHWMTRGVRVSMAQQPDTIHDFGGFPQPLYELQYPAPGHPGLAQTALDALAAAGWPVQADAGRGLDHGAWVPLRYLFPEADVPVFQVSLPAGLDEAGAFALGQALAPLREQGVLVIGSGSLTHNLYEWRSGQADGESYALEFVEWVRDVVARGDSERLQQTMAQAPHAQRAHPTTEHLLPLMVAAGAAGTGMPGALLDGGITGGVLSMDAFVFNPAAPA